MIMIMLLMIVIVMIIILIILIMIMILLKLIILIMIMIIIILLIIMIMLTSRVFCFTVMPLLVIVATIVAAMRLNAVPLTVASPSVAGNCAAASDFAAIAERLAEYLLLN